MNRRGFIGLLSGAVASFKTAFRISPAASAIQPTCERPYEYTVSFITRNGLVIPPAPVLTYKELRTITFVDSVPPELTVGSFMLPVAASASDSVFAV